MHTFCIDLEDGNRTHIAITPNPLVQSNFSIKNRRINSVEDTDSVIFIFILFYSQFFIATVIYWLTMAQQKLVKNPGRNGFAKFSTS